MIVSHTFENDNAASIVRHVSLGFFDGLHLAHREVVCDPSNPSIPLENHAVFTFEAHPMSVLSPENKPLLITGIPHKLEILESWGIGAVILLPFDISRSEQSAEEFLDQLGKAFPKLEVVRCGPNWRFGHQRRGGIPMLSAWARSKNVSLSIPQPVEYKGEWVSSSRIRQEITVGNLEEAAQMLGRPVSLMGTVVQGQQLGRKIGFPTINLSTQDECIPPHGVYKCSALLADGSRHTAVVNIGIRPTISSTSALSIEGHILDFSRDIYGETVLLEFEKFIRAEKKFEGLESLKQAISRDIEVAKSL